MSYVNKVAVFAIMSLAMSTGAAFAQAGGPDVPSDAKKQGTMENGSSSTGMKKDGAMTTGGAGAPKDAGKGSMTGGNAGGPASKN